MTDSFFTPQWPVAANVKACITTRLGGCSEAPFDSNNMATHVDDDVASVAHNRQQLIDLAGVPSSIQWLEQIHGHKVVIAQGDELVRTADGCFTDKPQLACAIMTADCLPVLLSDRKGTQVAAVHAGWRGLSQGILRQAMKRFSCASKDVLVYLGPAIGQANFEVGIDVLEAFYENSQSAEQLDAITAAFKPSLTKAMRFHADIYQLARAELNGCGVEEIYGGDLCTYADESRFYSYRRDGATGRMASLIWLS